MANTDTIQIYVASVEARNFSEAGKKLGLTPSAVSKQISNLETQLGVRLLNRTTRSVSPTEAGNLYYERCRRILEDIHEAEQMVRDLDASPSGTLRIWVPSIFGRSLLARVVADFTAAFPNITVDLLLSDAPMDLTAAGYDTGIHIGELPDTRLVAKTLGPMTLVLCASPEYLQQHGTPLHLAELAKHDMLVVNGNDFVDIRKIKTLAVNADFFHRPTKFVTNDLDLAYHGVLAGLGIAALPLYLIQRHVETGRLVHLFPDYETPSQLVHIIYSKPQYLSQKTRKFIDFISTYFIEREAEFRAQLKSTQKRP